ncbi:translation initiation factor IF-2-like [Molothrus ater]|uniref:translation initiation factor IF-2-like n=1 Tax=Molothrus ater TaxID=84834 RepID=UPI00174D7DB1|nr:translation initiation factor IF-2-like [Molothrus ater]
MTRGPGCAGLRGAGTPRPHGGPRPAPLAPGPAAPPPGRGRAAGPGRGRCAGSGGTRGLRPWAARPRGGRPSRPPLGFFKFLFRVSRRDKASSPPPPLRPRHPPADPGPAPGGGPSSAVRCHCPSVGSLRCRRRRRPAGPGSDPAAAAASFSMACLYGEIRFSRVRFPLRLERPGSARAESGAARGDCAAAGSAPPGPGAPPGGLAQRHRAAFSARQRHRAAAPGSGTGQRDQQHPARPGPARPGPAARSPWPGGSPAAGADVPGLAGHGVAEGSRHCRAEQAAFSMENPRQGQVPPREEPGSPLISLPPARAALGAGHSRVRCKGVGAMNSV